MATTTVRSYTTKEEIFHSITHGVGILYSVAFLAVLVTLSAVYGNVWSIVSTSIFGATMVLMYSASTIYHAIQSPKAKPILKKIDHIAIYFLIAGTYTPILLVLMRGTLGWTMFGIVWGLAVLGTVLKLSSKSSGTKLWSIGLYLAMGWLIVSAAKTVMVVVPPVGLIFLLLGGLFYTIGVFFYVWKSKCYTHVVWHCFVLLGTIMHSFAILFSCVFV